MLALLRAISLRTKGSIMQRLMALLVGLAMCAPMANAEHIAPVGRKVDNFKLQDYRGAEHSLSDHPDSRATVIAAAGNGVPAGEALRSPAGRVGREIQVAE